MKVSLTVLVSGPMQGKKIPITIPRFLIGRAPECNLQPGNPTISKTHCVLKLAGNRVLVEDLRSSTGTFVNDKKLEGEIQLNNGDHLKIGPLIFGLTIEAIAEPIPPQPAAQNKPKPVPETGVMPASAVAGETGEISLKSDETVFDKQPKAKEKVGDTSTAAKELLKKYLRRKRNMDEPRV